MNTNTLPDAADDGNVRDEVKRAPTLPPQVTFNEFLKKWTLRGRHHDGVDVLLKHLQERGITISNVDELNKFMDENPDLFCDLTDEDLQNGSGRTPVRVLWSFYRQPGQVRRWRAVIKKT